MTSLHAGISAVAKEVPEKVLTNADLERMVSTSDEWITSRTGIRERRIHKGPTSDLAVGALRKALDQRGIGPEELDAIIVATITPDHSMPSTACIVQHRVGAKRAWAFDISAACSGFLYGLQVAAQLVRGGVCHRVALIGADVMSSIVDYTKRDTCILFGDAAACVLVEPCDSPGVQDFILRSDGSGAGMLNVPAGGSAMPLTPEVLEARQQYVHMAGKEVFRYAVTGMTETCREILARHGKSPADVAYLVAHQANARILEAARERLDLPKERVYINLDRFGNTTGASIPLCLAELHESKKLNKGDLLLLTAFGAGFTWGSGLVRWTL